MISDTEAHISAPRARRLVLSDIKAIAKLVATRKMTEKDACITLGIKQSQWAVWKTRNNRSEMFENIIARVRGNQTDHLVSIIERAGDDQEITLPNGKVINKRGDWRAPAWLLEKTAPQFAPTQQSAPATVSIQIGLVHDQLKRVIGFTNPSATALLPGASDIVADAISEPLKSNLSKVKMPIRKSVD